MKLQKNGPLLYSIDFGVCNAASANYANGMFIEQIYDVSMLALLSFLHLLLGA